MKGHDLVGCLSSPIENLISPTSAQNSLTINGPQVLNASINIIERNVVGSCDTHGTQDRASVDPCFAMNIDRLTGCKGRNQGVPQIVPGFHTRCPIVGHTTGLLQERTGADATIAFSRRIHGRKNQGDTLLTKPPAIAFPGEAPQPYRSLTTSIYQGRGFGPTRVPGRNPPSSRLIEEGIS